MKTNMEKFYSVISLLLFIVEVSSISKYDLKSVCDGPSQLLTIPTDGDILLSQSSSDPLLPNKTCVVSIYNPMTKYPGRVLAYFESFSTDDSKNCVNSRLDIFDERGTSGNKALTGANGVCGDRESLDVYYNSTQQYMTFRFRDVNQTSNFKVVLTAAHTEYFKSACNQTIPIPDEGDILFVIDKSHPLSNSPCTVFVFNQNSPSRVLVNLNKFKIDGSKKCTQSGLDIYNGHGSNKKQSLTGQNGLCGSVKIDLYNSAQQNMTFTVHDNKGTALLTLLVTSARKGACHHNELNCRNGFCIPAKLACNGYNNCGNGIDELTCVLSLAVGVIIAIVIGALLGIACLTTVIICVVCRPHHRRRYRQI